MRYMVIMLHLDALLEAVFPKAIAIIAASLDVVISVQECGNALLCGDFTEKSWGNNGGENWMK